MYFCYCCRLNNCFKCKSYLLLLCFPLLFFLTCIFNPVFAGLCLLLDLLFDLHSSLTISLQTHLLCFFHNTIVSPFPAVSHLFSSVLNPPCAPLISSSPLTLFIFVARLPLLEEALKPLLGYLHLRSHPGQYVTVSPQLRLTGNSGASFLP